MISCEWEGWWFVIGSETLVNVDEVLIIIISACHLHTKGQNNTKYGSFQVLVL